MEIDDEHLKRFTQLLLGIHGRVWHSCFAGTIFQSKSSREGHPPYISDLAKKPVREFITAGQADEVVPSKSVFTPEFAVNTATQISVRC